MVGQSIVELSCATAVFKVDLNCLPVLTYGQVLQSYWHFFIPLSFLLGLEEFGGILALISLSFRFGGLL